MLITSPATFVELHAAKHSDSQGAADSFAVMRTLLIAAMGEELTAEELPIFTQLTGRTETPTEPP